MSWSIKCTQTDENVATCFHASVVCGEKLYIHGGYKQYPSQDDPSSDVCVYQSENPVQKLPVQTAGPARSHHTAVALDSIHICIVGGWDGKKRTTDVWIFDTEKLKWHQLNPTTKSNPPVGQCYVNPYPSGQTTRMCDNETKSLSSHTCTLVNHNEMIITGREGGVRMQRRYGSVYKLKINLTKQTYQFEEMPNHISSRSGHTACLLQSSLKQHQSSVIIVGGRDSSAPDYINIGPTKLASENEDLQKQLTKMITEKSKLISLTKPKALRHHCCTSACQWSVIHGGEVFGKVRDCTSGDIFIHDSTALKWWQANDEKNQEQQALKRYGHSMAWLNGKLYLLGGIGTQGKQALTSVVEIQFPT